MNGMSRAGMNKAIWGALLSLLFVGQVWAMKQDVLVTRCSEWWEWRIYLGWEFPGARGRVSFVDDPERGRCLRVDFSFHARSQYAGALWEGEILKAEDLRFWIKLGAPHGGLVRLRDRTGQEHLTGFEVSPGKWQRLQIPITPERFRAYWGGANDGKFYFPLTAIFIGVRRKPEEGYFLLSDVSVGVSDPPLEMCWRLSILPDVPSGVAFKGERSVYQVRVLNCLKRRQKATLEISVQGVDQKEPEKMTLPVEAKGWEEKVVKVPLPTEEPGYWAVQGRLLHGGKVVAEAESGLAVVEKPANYGKEDPQCYFGIQSVADWEAIERLGCKAVRLALAWRWTEPSKGLFYWERLDKDMAEARKRHMQVLLTVCAIPPSWAAWELWRKRPIKRKGIGDRPAPKHLDDWREFVRRVVERYRGSITALEIENEPDLTCWVHPKFSFEEGVDYYVRLLRAGRQGAKSADPECVIAGLDVSGGDFNRGLKYTQAVLERAAPLLDLFTGHPYASPRYFGPGLRPKWPEESDLAGKCRRALDLLERFGKPRRMWIGELGWGLSPGEPPLSPHSLDFAACVARALIWGKTVPGVEKFLWWTMRGCDWRGYEYGLFRGKPLYPLPAACAYATCARMLHHARPVRQIDLGATLRAWRFDSPDHRRTVVAIWSKGDEIRLKARVPAPTVVVDSFGREVDRGPVLDVKVGKLPLYISAPLEKGREMEGALREARLQAEKPAEIERVWLSRLRELTVRLVNHLNRPIFAILSVAGVDRRIKVKVGESKVKWRLPKPATAFRNGGLFVRLRVDKMTQKLLLPVKLRPLPKILGVKVDGELSEWSTFSPIRLAEEKFILPPNRRASWGGKGDLSLKAWMGWSERSFLFAAEVVDDVHCAPFTGANDFWNSDSIQVAFDFENDSADGFDDDDREIGFVLGEEGAKAFLTYPHPRRSLDCPLAVKRLRGRTVYEASVPWEAMGIEPPSENEVVAINFILNENDCRGREFWMGPAPGIGEAKRPSAYWEFFLAPSPSHLLPMR